MSVILIGPCQDGGTSARGDPAALRCMTPGTGSASWGLLPLSIISPMSRCHMQVSAVWETLYLQMVSADPAVQEIYWFPDWMLGCIKLCDRWFPAGDVGWDVLVTKTFAWKIIWKPWENDEKYTVCRWKTKLEHSQLVNFLVNFSGPPMIAARAKRQQPLASRTVLWR